ncbi:MAG: 50S ribosomal protein L5 [Candidatus Shapirobacteria bacterium]
MLRKDWEEKIKPELAEKLGFSNLHEVPALEKIVVHMGIAAEKDDPALIEEFSKQLGLITGQKPRINRAKKAVSGFKLRKGEIVGLKSTLRGKRMYDFVEIIVKLILPRLRDFRGLPTSKFDSQANYSLGISEQTVFPTLPTEEIKRIKGVEITFVVSSAKKKQVKELLLALGLPLVEKGK